MYTGWLSLLLLYYKLKYPFFGGGGGGGAGALGDLYLEFQKGTEIKAACAPCKKMKTLAIPEASVRPLDV